MFGPLGLSLEFEEIQSVVAGILHFLIFLGRLAMKVVFISNNFYFQFGPLSLNIKF